MNVSDWPESRSVKAYTAAQISAALRVSKRAILYALRDANVDSARIVSGNVTAAWSFSLLPARLQQQLTAKAEQQGYRNAEQLLASPAPAWQPAIPLNQVSQADLDKACKLQRALAPSLARMADLTIGEAAFEQRGLEDHRREFGYAISARHWRRLFRRTLDRDGGAEQFERLEIYLHERPARTEPGIQASAHAELLGVIARFRNPAAPTPDEAAYFWTRIFEHFEQRIASGKPHKKTRRSLLAFLFARAPFLAATHEGLRKQFDRKYAGWTVGGRLPSAVEDRRHKHSGRFRGPQLSEQDRDQLVGHAVLFAGGRLSQAWRELRESSGLSDDLLGYYLGNPADKSHVPRRIRDQVKHEIALLDDIHHGPRQAKLNGAHISRDWSFVPAGDWFQADDVTLPVYYYEPDGHGWFTLWRGQMLLMIDLRTTRILGYALLSSRNYNSLAIRTVITKVCDEHGLPHKGFYFERGIWQSSKILTGESSRPALSDPQMEGGLRDLGLRLIHARLPRSKVIEWVIGALQNLMEGEPGYIGRCEQTETFERVQKLKLQVKSRKLHPEGHFLSAEQWLTRLDEVCDRHNATPQNGKMLNGLSPDAAFEQLCRQGDPPIKFDASCRFLLAHHRRPLRVTRNGITLRFGKQAYNYRNEITGRLIGQTVLAWFNPETPEILCVTDMNRENPFAIERSPDLPAIDAPPDLLAEEMQRIAAHQSHAVSYYRTLKSKFAPRFRRNLLDTQTAELGKEFAEQTAATRSRVTAKNATIRRAHNAAKALNVRLSANDPKLDRRARGLLLMQEAEGEGKEQL